MIPTPTPSLTTSNTAFTGLGVIEGFFGQSWTWTARHAYATWLAEKGYSFYIYAPKEDACLRRSWWQSWPEAEWQSLIRLRHHCQQSGLAFGIGLTPLGAHHDYAFHKPRLLARLAEINTRLQPDILAILFDDMPSDTPKLAELQLTIAHDIACNSVASRHIFCPSFYSTDPILEKVFGAMPVNYWSTLAKGLDNAFDLFWTGPKVCSDTYPSEHLQWVVDALGRKPFLWDNYPVNDGKKASDYIYLRAFKHRPASLADYIRGHAVNPMKQPWLSQIPLATLPMSYQQRDSYDAEAAWQTAAHDAVGADIAALLFADLPQFCDLGLAQLTNQQQRALQQRYVPYSAHPAVREVLGWLAGDYRFDPACLTG